MRSRTTKGLLIVAAVALCGSAAPADSRGTITGRITDNVGGAIPDARLLFHPDPSGEIPPKGRTDVVRETDRAGLFNVQLEPGFYDVCILAMAFTPQCKKMIVNSGETIQYNRVMEVDPLIIEYLGHKY